MSVAFEADRVSVEGDPECPHVMFASESAAESHRLRFTRGPDVGGAGPTVRCESDELGLIDGVVRVLLTPTRAVVTFDAPDGEGGTDTREFVVGFRVTADERNAVRRAMKQVFRGTGRFVDDAATG